jgi:protein O-GlcNAc transferase
MNVPQILAQAVRAHQAGNLAQAEAGYRQILQSHPKHGDALHLLGVIAYQTGQPAAAIGLIRDAIAVSPRTPEYHNNLGQALQQVGEFGEAEACYRRAVSLAPKYAEAHNNLGNALREQKRTDEAAAAFRRAIKLKSNYAEPHSNLGTVLLEQGDIEAAATECKTAVQLAPQSAQMWTNFGTAQRAQKKLPEAEASLRKAISLNPRLAQSHYNLGVVLLEDNRTQESIAALQQALALNPRFVEALNQLGLSLQKADRMDEAVAAFQQCLAVDSTYTQAWNNLGILHKSAGRLGDAVNAFRAAIAQRPDYAEAYNNLGLALGEAERLPEAVAALEKAIALKARFKEPHVNLAAVLARSGQLDRAIEVAQAAIEIDPTSDAAHQNWGNALKDRGELDAAFEHYRQAVALNHEGPLLHSNLLISMHYHPDYSPARLLAEHREWAERHEDPLRAAIKPHANRRDEKRRIRIAYISPDFISHAIARFLLPIFRNRDRAQFELVCYCDVPKPDATTLVFRELADVWRNVAGMSDPAVAEIIRADEVDILVDLAAHAARNRLLVFARKPCPVQVTYLAYSSTTGLRSMDYRITDPYMDPPDRDESVYSERSVRLPKTYWCCAAPDVSVQVNPLPALTNGHVTFGCLNSFCKASRPALDAWADIMRQVPGSKLILFAHPGSHRERTQEHFARAGVAAERVSFVGTQSLEKYFGTYNQIDLALDPFPFNGGTTTCDCLWMGVPVVTFPGETAVSRGGLSLMSNVGLPQFIGRSRDDYIRIAVETARDLPALARVRAKLRGQLEASPVMDHQRFARDLEKLYRQMWVAWCRSE